MADGKKSQWIWAALVLVALLALVALVKWKLKGHTGHAVKIGFVVNQPESAWFQMEWKFAEEAAQEKGFDLIKIGATDGEKALSALDNLAANGAQGVIICPPDVRLGPALAAKAKAAGLKLMTVDDRFVGADGQFMAEVPYLGIAAKQIGRNVGAALYKEMQARKWEASETAVCAATWEELNTAKERTDGAIDALVEAGFPKASIFKAPQKTADVPGAFDAVNIVLTQHRNVKHWLLCGNNDNAVMGGVRATEGAGLKADNVVGIGINGTDCIPELEKPQATGFFATILLAPKQHGYGTALAMYQWIKDNVEPAKDTRTTGLLITRDNFRQVLKEQGIVP